MKNILLFLLSTILLSSCNTYHRMTQSEIRLIQSVDNNAPFKVLLTSNANEEKKLRQPSRDLNFKKDKKVIDLLISRLKATMFLESGVGIAAPQIGISRNLFLFVRVDKPDEQIEVAINPKILNHPNETIYFERDGCLSVPNFSGNSIRYPWIEVEYTNENGVLIREKLEGYSRQDNFVAVIFQHEFDHLQGVLFIDKLCK